MPEQTTCPDCSAPLGKGALKCRCGWRASFDAQAEPTTRCEIDGCGAAFLGCIEIDGKRTPACEKHYTEHHGRILAAGMATHAKTREANRERVLQILALGASR